MLAGIAGFSIMDAIIKWLTADYPVPQVVALRSWFGLPLLCVFALHDGGLKSLRTRRPLVHVGRYLLVLILSLSFFWALSQMKLVDAIAVTFASPIFITVLSVPLLKEPVGLHRWAAIGVGFLGVLIILRPGMGVFSMGGAGGDRQCPRLRPDNDHNPRLQVYREHGVVDALSATGDDIDRHRHRTDVLGDPEPG